MVRISSMCNFGHLWGSQYCDCRWQLEEARKRVVSEGRGLIVFAFDHQGKSVGLENHYRVYTEGQRLGLELVVDAYKALGYPEDLRDYSDVVKILKEIGLAHIRLLTNSTTRLNVLRNAGVRVDHVPLEMPLTPYNQTELAVKKFRLGHTLSFEPTAELAAAIGDVAE